MAQQERKPIAIADDETVWPVEAVTLSRLLADRFSCRSYRPDPVPRATIAQMLQIAQMSASWCNSQPWQAIVTEGDATERFRHALLQRASADQAMHGGPAMEPDFPFPENYRGVYKDRQREVGWQLYESVGVAFGDREASGRQALENFRLFGAPHALIVTSPRDLGVYGAIDSGLYIGNLLLAAQALGIGMIAQAALACYAPLMHEHFDIPEDRMVVLGASFGFADENHPSNSFRSRRASLEDAVKWIDR